MATQISEFIDAIITFPEDIVEINDLTGDFPDWKKLKVQNFMIRAKDLGYVKPVDKKAAGKKPQKYKILKRTPYITGYKYSPRKQVEGLSIKQRIINIISSHPGDMIISSDVFKHFKNVSQSTLKVTFARDMVRLGYIKPLKGAYVNRNRRYQILKRDSIKESKSAVSKEDTKKALDELDKEVSKMEKDINEKIIADYVNNLPVEKLMNLLNDVTMAQIGKFVVLYIGDLEKKIREMSTSYSDLQSDLRKEKDAARITISTLNKKVTDLNGQIRILKDKVRELSRGGSGGFKLGEIASFTKK